MITIVALIIRLLPHYLDVMLREFLGSVLLVDDLSDADDRALLVAERDAEHAARPVACAPVHRRVKPRVLACKRHRKTRVEMEKRFLQICTKDGKKYVHRMQCNRREVGRGSQITISVLI